MTNEQINAAIAEACGWTDMPIIDGMYGQTPVPNYCTDLNAMHEAEEALLQGAAPGVWECFRNKLRSKYGEDDIHTTARQRAEAFLRTLGKWEEDTK